MPRVSAEVQLDAGVLALVDQMAAASGLSREQVIEASVRGGVWGKV